jgi:hypothetical protein
MARYRVRVRTDHEAFYSTYLYCGLYDLVADGVISLHYKHCFWPNGEREIYTTLLDVIDQESGTKRTIAIDWRDNANVFGHNKMAVCDVYYKRNYIPEITEPACPPEHRDKLRPLGITFAVRNEHDRSDWIVRSQGLWRDERPWREKSPRDIIHSLYRSWKQPEVLHARLTQADFETDDIENSQNVVLFQTWPYNPTSSPHPGDSQATTDERALFIRTLKEGLGERFVGGFHKLDMYSSEYYPECAAPKPMSHAEYIAFMKTCRICVYSHGVRDSLAFKLGEYLASSRCIVAQRIKTKLPVPLEDGRDVLFFDTAKEMVEKSRQLLDDEALQRRLSKGAHDYYQMHVKPRERVLQLFQEAFALEPRLKTRVVGAEA